MQGLQQFLAFAQTARRGSFAAAARDLGQAPSTLAKSVARLELQLGVKLFHRTTRQVSLTPDGDRLYQRCQRVLAEIEELHADAAGTRATPAGTLRRPAPMPNRPSTTTPHDPSGISSRRVATVTLKNFSFRRSATTRASPPLLPGPASTRMCLPLSPASVAAISAAAAPARSISAGLASPAARSTRRMSSHR